MRRREFISFLGGAAAWPVAGRAQQRPATPTIGWLDQIDPNAGRNQSLAAFRQGLALEGYVVGQNVSIEYDVAESDVDRMRALAADLVRRQVAVIVTTTGTGAHVAKVATQTIPIVFSMGGDPVEEGVVASLNHPGGNVTGVAIQAAEIAAKRLELLHELAPKAESIAAVVGPAGPVGSDFSRAQTKGFQAAALALGVRLLPVTVVAESDIAGSLASAVQQGAGAVLVGANRPFVPIEDKIISATNSRSLPSMFYRRDAVAAGALASYGAPVSDINHLVGVYAGRILKGAKPADLPVQQPTKFNLVINLKTAKALGLNVPQTLLVAADEVIE